MSDRPAGPFPWPWPWNTARMAGDDDPIPWAKMLGDEDPFPLRSKSTGKIVAKWTAGVGTFTAFQIGPYVEVVAVGTTSNFNTRAKLAPVPTTAFPPEFILLFLEPEVSLPTISPFVATASFFSTKPLSSVNVWDKNGKHKVAVAPGE